MWAPLFTATAAAQPAATAPTAPIGPAPAPRAAAPVATCQVGVSRAPDDVRAAIAQWVNAEPRCATSLEVRVVATEGGYYVLAYSGNGRVFERVVPDAQAVGVLVASWAADDHPAPSVAPAPAPPASGPPAIAPSAPAPSSTNAGLAPAAPAADFRPPSAVAPIAPTAPSLQADGRDTGARAPAKPEQRWLAMGAMAQIDADDDLETASGSQGLRVDLDLLRFGRISLGAGFGLVQSNFIMYGYSTPYGYIDTDDVRITGSINYTRRSGKWAFRATGSVGVLYTSGNGQFDAMPVSAEGAFPMVEAAAVVARDLSSTWGLVAGPVVTGYQQDYVFSSNGSYFSTSRSPELSLYAALLKRL